MHTRLDREGSDARVAQLARRLRELPAEERPPYAWEDFKLRAERSRAAADSVGWPYAAVAAAAAFALIGLALWSRLSTPDGFAPVANAERPRAEARWHRPDVAEGWLATLPSEPAIVRVNAHLGVMELEDSIAWVDEMLTLERAAARPSRVQVLERERSRLVDSLVRVRYAESLAAEVP